MGEISTVTTPYADDFCPISTHRTTHQNLIDNIHSQISSMEMKLKPSKCTSSSISGGKPVVVPFHIGDNENTSIRDEDQKFLGKLLFFRGKSEETFNPIKNNFLEGIANIDKAMVRNDLNSGSTHITYSHQNVSCSPFICSLKHISNF